MSSGLGPVTISLCTACRTAAVKFSNGSHNKNAPKFSGIFWKWRSRRLDSAQEFSWQVSRHFSLDNLRLRIPNFMSFSLCRRLFLTQLEDARGPGSWRAPGSWYSHGFWTHTGQRTPRARPFPLWAGTPPPFHTRPQTGSLTLPFLPDGASPTMTAFGKGEGARGPSARGGHGPWLSRIVGVWPVELGLLASPDTILQWMLTKFNGKRVRALPKTFISSSFNSIALTLLPTNSNGCKCWFAPKICLFCAALTFAQRLSPPQTTLARMEKLQNPQMGRIKNIF